VWNFPQNKFYQIMGDLIKYGGTNDVKVANFIFFFFLFIEFKIFIFGSLSKELVKFN